MAPWLACAFLLCSVSGFVSSLVVNRGTTHNWSLAKCLASPCVLLRPLSLFGTVITQRSRAKETGSADVTDGPRAAIPNIFVIRDWFQGRQFLHGPVCVGGHISSGNVSDGEQWGAADEDSLARPPLTYCCVARFLTGRGPVLVRDPGIGRPCPRAPLSGSEEEQSFWMHWHKWIHAGNILEKVFLLIWRAEIFFPKKYPWCPHPGNHPICTYCKLSDGPVFTAKIAVLSGVLDQWPRMPERQQNSAL